MSLPGNIGLLARWPNPATNSQFGNVDGPASSTDNAIVRWDGATGRLIQNSAAILSDQTNTATSGSQTYLSLAPIYNQASGTAANTDLLINRTETAVGSGAQLLADFQVGGTSQVSINNAGLLTFKAATANTTGIRFGTDAALYRSSTGGVRFDALSGDASLNLAKAGTNYGNLIVDGAAFYISSTAAQSILLRTNNTTALTLDSSQNATFAKKITSYNGIATAGNGVVSVQGVGRATAQTAAVAAVATYTVGAADASFIVSFNVLVTASTTHNFTVTCSYTDESNTARTGTMNSQVDSGTIGTTITQADGAVPHEGIPMHIRAKAGTAITVATTGTFTDVTYNVEAAITKLQ